MCKGCGHVGSHPSYTVRGRLRVAWFWSRGFAADTPHLPGGAPRKLLTKPAEEQRFFTNGEREKTQIESPVEGGIRTQVSQHHTKLSRTQDTLNVADTVGTA